jgi:hypothetical protein
MPDNDNALPPIRGDVSIAIRSETLSPHDAVLVEGTRGFPVLAQAKQSFNSMYKELSLITDARTSAFQQISPLVARQMQLAKEGRAKPPAESYVGPDGLLHLHLPSATARDFNSASELAFRRGASQLDAARTSAIKVRGELAEIVKYATTDATAKSASGIALAAEIRAHIKTLPAGERLHFARDQILAGNLSVACAVKDSPAFLSGIDAKAQAILVDEIEKKFASKERGELDSMDKLILSIEDAGNLAVAHLKKSLVPEPDLSKQATAAMSRLRTGGR